VKRLLLHSTGTRFHWKPVVFIGSLAEDL